MDSPSVVPTFGERVINEMNKFLEGFASEEHPDRLLVMRSSIADRPVEPHTACFFPSLQVYAKEHEDLHIPTEFEFHRADGLFGVAWCVTGTDGIAKRFSCPRNSHTDYESEISAYFQTNEIKEIDVYFPRWGDYMKMALTSGCFINNFMGHPSVLLIESRTRHRSSRDTWNFDRINRLFKEGLPGELSAIISGYETTHDKLCRMDFAGAPQL